MDPYEQVDDLSPTPEQEEARRRLWRQADQAPLGTQPGGRSQARRTFEPLETPPLPPRPRRAPPADPRLSRRGAPIRETPPQPDPPSRRGPSWMLLLATGLLLAATAATCSAGMDTTAVMSEYGDPMLVSPSAAADVFARGASVLQELPDSGLLRVTLTDEEATSVLGLGFMLPELVRAMHSVSPEEVRGPQSIEEIRRRLRTRILASDVRSVVPTTLAERVAAALDPRLAVEGAQIRFADNGQVVLAGSIRAWRLRQPALVVVTPRVEAGRLELDFQRVRLGRIPAPPGLFDRLGRLIPPERLLGARYTEITELEVGDGTLTVEGRIE